MPDTPDRPDQDDLPSALRKGKSTTPAVLMMVVALAGLTVWAAPPLWRWWFGS
jgi:hypothetical protein